MRRERGLSRFEDNGRLMLAPETTNLTVCHHLHSTLSSVLNVLPFSLRPTDRDATFHERVSSLRSDHVAVSFFNYLVFVQLVFRV